MRRAPETLEEARQERLRSGRRGEFWGRLCAFVGIGIALVLLVAVAVPVCGRVVPLGKRDMAAGEYSNAILVPWDEAEIVFRQALPSGPTVEARQVAWVKQVPPGAEFRVDGVAAGVVFGETLWKLDLRGTKVALDAGDRITIHLPPGYRPAQSEVEARRWKVRYRTQKDGAPPEAWQVPGRG